MLAFLSRVWELAKHYRTRLFLGIAAGIISGLMQPVMIGTIVFVYGAVFPSADVTAGEKPPLRFLPAFVRQWYDNTHKELQSLQVGMHSHPGAVLSLILVIPLVMFLRGFFGYLN